MNNMNFDLFSLRKLLKTLNDIHKNEIFTLEENVGTYTVYKDNRFYFEGVKSSEQDSNLSFSI